MLTKHGEAVVDTVENNPKDTSAAINLNCDGFNSELYLADEQVKKNKLKTASVEDVDKSVMVKEQIRH